MAKRGRPTAFKPEYVQQTEKLAVMGFSDEAMAFFFGVDIAEFACWAWYHKEFFEAITPAESKVMAYQADVRSRREKINRRKRAAFAGNPSLKIRNAMAARLWAALKGRADGALFRRLGYSLKELMAALEEQFLPGMTWNNYGKWHVDHKRPCASFDLADEKQFAECWALSNLQPLWALDNFRKGASYGCA